MHTVKVRLRKPRRVFTFICDDASLRRDDACVVQSDRGLEYGTCILPPEPCPPEMQKRFSMRVLRRVNDQDERTRTNLVEQERKSRKICLDKIRAHKLPMKLVDVEYTLDKRKIIFYFTAEDRVDFRELVRDLAHELKTRIELRHIQVRDEAKMVGGIGSCGRELCCSTWLNEFKPISMRMAKRQNLSLNPSKISGQCGRLLCCLSYENELYEDMKRRARQVAPVPEEPFTPEDEATVAVLEEKDEEEVALMHVPEPPVEAAAEPDEAASGGAPQTQGGDADRKRKRRRRRGKRGGGGAGGGGQGGAGGGGA